MNAIDRRRGDRSERVRTPTSGGERGVLRWVAGAFLGSLLVLSALLFAHQLTGGDELEKLGAKQRTRHTNVRPERGAILAVNGEPLCYNRPVYRFVMDIKALRHPRERLDITVQHVSQRLAEFSAIFDRGAVRFNVSDRRIAARIRRHGYMNLMLSGPEGEPPDVVARYARFRELFPEVRLEMGYRRECTASPALVNLLGRVGAFSPSQVEGVNLDYIRPIMVGTSGMEHVLDPFLRGRSGAETITVDACGFHPMGTEERMAPLAGISVRTTLDPSIQELGERSFGAGEGTKGAFVVVEVAGMEVRALGSFPAADYSLTDEQYAELSGGADKKGLLLDRARFWRTPPGSTFKMITILAALMSGRLGVDERIYCPGYCMVGGKRRPCGRRHGHGWITAEEALAHSCNVFTYEAAKRAGGDAISSWARAFGFGERFDGRSCLPAMRSSKLMKARNWGQTGLWNLCIGQGETEANVVALAMYVRALATGELMVPTYVVEDSLPVGTLAGQPSRVVRRLALRPEVRDAILRGMLGCTVHGTGRSAACGGIQILAKTGTAQTGPKKEKRKNALMVALVPAENPKYCIVCAIADSASGGGRTVGPRMREFVQGMVGLGHLSSTSPKPEDG